MYLSINKDESLKIKGIAICLMVFHHLFAFPERLNYIFDIEVVEDIGRRCGVCIGIFCFLSGYAFDIKCITFQLGLRKLKSFYLAFLKVFLIFIPIGIIIGYYSLGNWLDVLKCLFLLQPTLNAEWWYVSLYVELLILSIPLFSIKDRRCFLVIAIISSLLAIVLDKYTNLPIFGLFRYWPVFVLGILIHRYDIFTYIDGRVESCVSKSWMRAILYFFCYTIIDHILNRPIQILKFPFIILFIVMMIPNIKQLRFIGKYSMNIWLIHPFICYYYWQDIFLKISNPFCSYAVLISCSAILAVSTQYLWKCMGKCVKLCSR